MFEFNESLVAFIGLNGVGKTNILDSIYTLCIGKTYFSSKDKQCIRDEEDFFRLEMQLEQDTPSKVVVLYQSGKRKRIEVDNIPHARNASHLGRFPIVLVAPNDNILILGSSDERRKLMDITLSQISTNYLNQLLKYNQVLKQRNALLKGAEDKGLNKNLLEIYNEDLCKCADFLHQERQRFNRDLKEYFEESFRFLSAKNEEFSIEYKSGLNENELSELLQNSLQKDLILKRTNEGVHRDDLVFKMRGKSIKEYGSQGQQKTFLLALKLTQFNFLKAQLNKVPLLIIDDIFDKLDMERSKNLLKFIAKQGGQVFISNTNAEIFQEIIDIPMQILEVKDGQ